MPLTPFQTQVLQVLAANRHPESHLAGGAVINRAPTSPRFSTDMDIFHDRAELVQEAWTADKSALEAAGFECVTERNFGAFVRTRVTQGAESTVLDWAHDSAWRFLPVIRDAIFGWRLSDADVAVNKALALAGREEGRDVVDTVYLDKQGFPLGALAWALPGKDPGFSPESAIEMMRANARVPSREDLHLRANYAGSDPCEIKRSWLALARRAETEVARAQDIGLEPGRLYFSPENELVWGEIFFAAPENFIAHTARAGGVWPVMQN
jgi:hypothetical protein